MCWFLRFAYSEQRSSMYWPDEEWCHALPSCCGCPNGCSSTHMHVFSTPRVKLMYHWFKFCCVSTYWSSACKVRRCRMQCTIGTLSPLAFKGSDTCTIPAGYSSLQNIASIKQHRGIADRLKGMMTRTVVVGIFSSRCRFLKLMRSAKTAWQRDSNRRECQPTSCPCRKGLQCHLSPS